MRKLVTISLMVAGVLGSFFGFVLKDYTILSGFLLGTLVSIALYASIVVTVDLLITSTKKKGLAQFVSLILSTMRFLVYCFIFMFSWYTGWFNLFGAFGGMLVFKLVLMGEAFEKSSEKRRFNKG